MLLIASIAGIVCLLIGMSDRRARPMAVLLALVWLETILIDTLAASVVAVALKVPVDLSAGILALGVVRKECWSLMVPALFSVILLCHAAFWLCGLNGVSIWEPYAYALTGLFLLQTASVAWPGGGHLIGRAGAWVRSLGHGWRSRGFLGAGKATRTDWVCETQTLNRRYRCADDGACGELQIPAKRT